MQAERRTGLERAFLSARRRREEQTGGKKGECRCPPVHRAPLSALESRSAAATCQRIGGQLVEEECDEVELVSPQSELLLFQSWLTVELPVEVVVHSDAKYRAASPRTPCPGEYRTFATTLPYAGTSAWMLDPGGR
jgi:hypothetical protein